MSNLSYKHLWQTKAVCFATLFTIFGGQLHGNPEGFQLVAGDAKPPVMDAPGSLVIKSGKNSVINWSSFSIDKKEKFRFEQANSKSSVLNRVTGKSQSSIYGQLESNGKIYLVNPHGVLIGPGARIESAGFLAATADIMNDDFLKGADLLFKDFGPGSVVNLGTIDCPMGDITLLARSVKNEGTLNTPKGVTSLATGTQILIKPSGSNRVFIQANLPEDSNEEASLQQTGAIHALAVELKSGVSPYAKAIKSSGHIDATSTRAVNGRIYLVAEQGHVEVSGTMTAKTGSQGGDIHVFGQTIDVLETAKIDVSGVNGGGEVLIGGSFQGKDRSVPHSEKTYIQKGAEISVSAVETGNGGRAIIWADGYTHFAGNIDAQGGKLGGDGGFVEVSGKEGLGFVGTSDRSAPLGQPGELFMDPKTIQIVAAGANPVSPQSFTDNPTLNQNIDPDAIMTALGTGNVTLQANSNIQVESNNMVIPSAANTLTLNCGTNLQWLNNVTMSLGAANLVTTVNDANCDAGIPSGSPPVYPNRDTVTASFVVVRDGAVVTSTTGNMLFGANVTYPAPSVLFAPFEGSELYVNGGTIHTDSGTITVNGQGRSNLSSPNPGILLGPEGLSAGGSTQNPLNNSVISTNSGHLILNGVGGVPLDGAPYNPGTTQYPSSYATGILIDSSFITPYGGGMNPQNSNMKSSIISSTTGSIAMTGTGGQADAGTNNGINMVGTLSLVTSATGTILMTGSGGYFDGNPAGGSSSHDDGIILQGGAQITSTGTGGSAATITLVGFGGGDSLPSIGFNTGVHITGTGSMISTIDGAISISGTGGMGVPALMADPPPTNNYGIFVDGQGLITSTGAGNIILTGTGGTGTGGTGVSTNNNGIYMAGTSPGSAAITSSGTGTITLHGQGSTTSTGTINSGIAMHTGSQINSTGIGTITLTGTGGTGTSAAHGIFITGTGTQISSSMGGNIALSGTGGNTATTINNAGIAIQDNALITDGGTGGANITLTGTGGSGTNNETGILMAISGMGITPPQITAVTGNGGTPGITILGHGGTGSGGTNYGVNIAEGTITSTGAARIAITGTGGTVSAGDGVLLGVTATPLGATNISATSTGNITVAGTGGAFSGAGINLGQDYTVNTTSSNITMTGTGGGGAANQFGIIANGAVGNVGTVSTTSGNITLHGTGRGTTTTNYGVFLESNTHFVTASATANGINITGTGGPGTNNNYGVFLNSGTVTFNSTSTGPIALTGLGGGSGGGASNYGILMNGGSTIAPAGTGSITLTGTGGPETDSEGVVLSDATPTGATITSTNGSIVINGQGGTTGASGNNNYGVGFEPLSHLTAIGSATITVTGTGGIGANSNNGVNFAGTMANPVNITGANGLVNIHGTGGGDGTGLTNDGINFASFVNVSVTGPGGITLSGTGGSGGMTAGLGNIGLLMTDPDATITSSGSGPISLIGQGGTGILADNQHGVAIGGVAVSTMTAPINITGTGGTGHQTSSGVVLFSSGGVGATVSSASGPITVVGLGGIGNPANGGNLGIVVNPECEIFGTGSTTISLTGTGGSGGTGNQGVYLLASVMNIPNIFSNSGNITLAGTGGTGGSSHNGIVIEGPAMGGTMTSTGILSVSGTVRLTGTGGPSATGTLNNGILMAGDPSQTTAGGLVQTTSGPIFFTGTGGGGTSGNSGIWIDNGSEVTSGSGNMTFIASSGTNTTTDFLMDPGPIIQSSAGANISITSLIDDVVMNPNSLITFTAGAGTLTITSARDFVMEGGASMNEPSSIILNTGNALITAARDGLMTSGTMSGSDASITAIGAVSLIEMIAGRNIVLSTPTAGVNTTIIGPNNVTLVTDNDFPASPGVGPGGFSLDANSSVDAGGQLRVYTAKPSENSILGTLNGANFSAGTFGVDTSQEQFFTYFPNGTYGGMLSRSITKSVACRLFLFQSIRRWSFPRLESA